MSFLHKKITRFTLSTCLVLTAANTVIPVASAADNPFAAMAGLTATTQKMAEDSMARTQAAVAQASDPAAWKRLIDSTMGSSVHPAGHASTTPAGVASPKPHAMPHVHPTAPAAVKKGMKKGIPKTWNGKGVPPTAASTTPAATKGIAKTWNGVGPAPKATTPVLRADDGQPIVPIMIRPRIDSPDHHWKTDLLSMLMAMHFGPVLHRVQGSWFNAPDVPRAAYAAEATGHALFGPGTPIYVGKDTICTLAMAGYDREGNKVGITAGHCGKPGDKVMSADSWPIGVAGYYVASDPVDDWAVIRFTDKAIVSRTYNGVTLDSIGTRAHTGNTVCKTGVATGTTCGVQFLSDERVSLAQYCAMHGDSGAPVYEGHTLVGIVGLGVFTGKPIPCTTPLQGPFFAPTATHHMGVIRAEIDARGGYGAGLMLPNPDGSDPHHHR